MVKELAHRNPLQELLSQRLIDEVIDESDAKIYLIKRKEVYISRHINFSDIELEH